MSALFGYLGDVADGVADGMKHRLAHRMTGSWLTAQTDGAALYYGAPPRFDAEDGGLFQDGTGSIALAGILTGELRTPEAVVAAYKIHGLKALEQLRGAFVLALWDGTKLILQRDGLGGRSLYWARQKGTVFFAVEPKALWSLPGFSRRLRPEAVARYLTFSFQPGHETMLEDIEAVPAGHILIFEQGRAVQSRRFFHFEHLEPETQEPDQANDIKRFSTFLQESVAARLRPGQPVGAFLSGGIDSSAVVAELVRQAPPKDVKTFAVHFGKDYLSELDFAREVAERCGTDHHEIQVKPKHFLPLMRRIVYQLDDPIGDPVTMPNYMLAQAVAGQLNGVFNGEGGDPCFGGPKNIPMMLLHWYPGEREPHYLERAYLASYRRAYDELNYLLAPDFRARFHHNQHLAGLLTPFFQEEPPKTLLNKLMAINIRLKGAQLILPKVERMLGAHGLVPLSPLFDERAAELSFSLHPKAKLAAGVEKLIIKRAMAGRLPESVINRPKSGMRVPVHFWLKGEMRRYARKILSKKAVTRAGIFDPERVKQLLAYDIEEAGGRYGIKLWMLITFEVWRRIVIEGETP